MNYTELPSEFPRPLAKILKFSAYSRGESAFSITDLIKPVQVTQLTRRHDSEITKDPRENIYSVLGSAVHDLLERVGNLNPDESEMIEERLFTTIEGVKISGQIDLHTTYDSKNHILTDWKHTKTSAIKFEKLEWHQQLNCYAHLLRQHGYEVSSARICAIFRDWSFAGINGKYKVSTEDGTKIVCKRTKDYPDWGCAIIEIPLWPDEEVEKYLKERVALHKAAENLSDEELFECTPEERWRRDTWRVRKTGAVRAKGNRSNFKTEAEARAYLEEMGPEFELSSRPGVAYRCLAYCAARPFCFQLKREGFEVIYEEGEEDGDLQISD